MLFLTLLIAASSAPFRLPAEINPLEYTLALDLDPEVEAYTGDVRISVAVKRPTKSLWLHGEGLTISAADVNGDAAQVEMVEGGYVRLMLSKSLPAGVAQVHLAYSAKQDSERSQGIYRVKEPDGHWYSYTFFEPIDARRAFPCFDEPGFKTPWKVTIRTPNGSIAAANSAEASRKPTAEGTEFVFAPSKPLPTYLVAFVVGPFEVVDAGAAGKHGTPLRFILPSGRAAELRYAKEVTPKLVGMLEDWFGIPYPFGKLDVAVVPRTWGTMEHPGLVAMGQPLTLIKPSEESLDRKREYANILLHEVGHYWFGDYVTTKWWDDTWLNEGTTEWIDRKLTHAFAPDWQYDKVLRYDRLSSLARDAMPAAKALSQRIERPTDIEASFDGALTYAKGAAVMAMLERWLGVATVQAAVRSYLQAHAWGSATSEDMVRALSEASNRDVAPVVKSFVEQPGAPLVSMALTCNESGATLHLAQRRFSIPDAPSNVNWHVPVCVRFGVDAEATDKCDVLHERTADWALAGACPTWIVGNADGVGYYRVAYDKLPSAETPFTVIERQAFLDDVEALARAGLLAARDALPLAASYAHDKEIVVQRTALMTIGSFIDPYHLPDALQPNHARMIDALMGEQARALGWQEKAGESTEAHDLRPFVVAGVAAWSQDSKLREEAKALAKEWLADRKAVAPDMAAVVLRIAARFGDQPLYDAMLAEAKRTESREDRSKLLHALARFRGKTFVVQSQQLALKQVFDPREGSVLGYAGLNEPKTRDLAWAFVKQNYDKLSAGLRDDERTWTFEMIADFCDQPQRDAAAKFFTPHAARINGGPYSLATYLAQADQCIAQRKRNARDVADFLKKY